ncbi:FadR/GntR family transcriptional regulator [Paracoccus sp. Ld10]|uniref:FadR/GntR family transcriptional regulator n=1 Tax=Paracoccus sp. Ld10 TaxID=649158 RepID=UPI00386CEC1C
MPPAISPCGPAVQSVADRIVSGIAAGHYPPGTRMPSERMLAVDYGVARGTLRAALDLVEARGLIRRRPGAGSFVQGAAAERVAPIIAATGPLHLQVMRGIIEPEMVRLAVIHMPPAQIDELAAIRNRMYQDTDPAALARNEDDFMLTLARGTGNPLLIACYDLIVRARSDRHRHAMLQRHMTPDRMTAQRHVYADLVEALASRDMDAAIDLCRHLLLDEQRLLTQEG